MVPRGDRWTWARLLLVLRVCGNAFRVVLVSFWRPPPRCIGGCVLRFLRSRLEGVCLL